MYQKLEKTWLVALSKEFTKDYFLELNEKIKKAYIENRIYPNKENIFAALNLCPLDKVKVVIIGQDPYHGEGQAHGLAFSVLPETKIPPSLKNIYKEISNDLGKEIPATGNLNAWAEQGVLLLNATLTVESQQPGSHQGIGWEIFTDEIIKIISDQKEHVVFLLWGKYAEAKANLIDETKHLVLKAPHPSPFSAHSGFFGCRHFSQANEYLEKNKIKPIDW